MRLGCAAYSYRDLLKSGAMSLEGFVDECAAMGLDGVELTGYYFPSLERAYLNHLKRHCFLRGQHVLATAVGSNFTQPDEEKRREHVRTTCEMIDGSVVLGAPCIRVFAGPLPAEVEEETAFRWALECLEECVAYGAERGVAVALENHGGVTGTAAQVQRFLNAIGSPWFGINLDFGNFREDPYQEFALLAPRAITTHAKLVSRFGEERREVDYMRVREIMEGAGYQGYLSIEYEESEDPRVAVPRFARQLREVVG
jgi:sugar phosphate isomerase/epimerase